MSRSIWSGSKISFTILTCNFHNDGKTGGGNQWPAFLEQFKPYLLFWRRKLGIRQSFQHRQTVPMSIGYR